MTRKKKSQTLFEDTKVTTAAAIRHEIKRVESTLDKVDDLYRKDWKRLEKYSEKLSLFAGSWKFVYGFLFILLCWIVLNVFILIHRPIDPAPFSLFNFCLSAIAVVQAPLIMMGQMRAAKMDKVRAEMDLEKDIRDLRIDQKSLEILLELQKEVRSIKRNMGQMKVTKK